MATRNSRATVALLLLLLAPLGVRASGTVTNCTEAEFRAAVTGGGTVTVACASSITLASAVTIAVDTVIIGPSSRFTLSATAGTNNTGSRLFHIAAGARLTLVNAVLANGRATNGGAIHSQGFLVASNCVFSNNVAVASNGAAGSPGSDGEFAPGGDGGNGGNGRRAEGGAIYNLGSAALTVCTFSDNSGTGGTGGNGGRGGNGDFAGGDGGDGGNGGNGQGGAIYNQGVVHATNCTFRLNLVVGGNGANGGTNGSGGIAGYSGDGGAAGLASGGAIYNGGFLTLVGCTLSSNEALGGNSAHRGTTVSAAPRGKDGAEGNGGAVANAGTNTLVNCTLRNNLARGGEGGDGAASDFVGGDGGDGGSGRGGNFFSSGQAWLTNCTLSLGSVIGGTNGLGGPAAEAGENGDPGPALGGNLCQGGGALVLKNSILDGNGTNANAAGTITDAGYNISSDGTPPLSGTSFGQSNPRLGDLSNNGGPTSTLPLLSGSPAIDKITAAACPPRDQRGFARPAGLLCDMGAFEYLGGIATGRVTDAISAVPVAGVQLTAYGLTTLTDTSGAYFLAGLPFNSPVNLQPSRTGYQFNPATVPLTLTTNSSPTNVNFAAFRLFTISGRVTTNDPSGALSNTTVIATSSGTSVTNVTGTNGNYTLTNVRAGSVVVTARRGGFLLAPSQYQFTVSSNTANINFTGTRVFRATGRVTDANYGFPVPGVTVTLAGTNVFTDTNGVYTFNQLLPGDYVISLAGGGYQFEPPQREITLEAHATNNFLARGTNSISGRITNFLHSGIAAVRVLAGMRTNHTDAMGRYAFSDLPDGSVTLLPSANGFSFTPASLALTVPPARTIADFLGAKLITLRGRVINTNSAPLPGVVITTVGNRTTQTDTNGNYTFTNISSGLVTVVPTLAGHVFVPPGYTNSPVADTTNNFTGFRIFNVSGRVRLAGAGLGGVNVSASNAMALHTNLTDNLGNFILSGLTSATYTVRASLPGYRFSPPSTNLLVAAAVTGLTFTATGIYSVSGVVTNGMGPVTNVSITASNSTFMRTVTNTAAGAYTVIDLPPAIYTVRATATDQSFRPASTNVDLTLTNAVVNFGLVSPITLGGRITDGSYGIPVPGVTVRYDARSTTTDTNGLYSFDGVEAGAYVVQPEAAGYEFTPALTTVNTPPSRTDLDFVAVGIYSIGGRITNRNDGTNLAGATVTANGRAILTGHDGRYTFTNLPTGTFTIQPALEQYTFFPTLADVPVPPNRPDINFSGAHLLRLSGRIRDLDELPLTNVTVTAAGTSTRTDAEGNYSLTNIPAGMLTITPMLSGYGFAPATRTELFTNDVTGRDFTGFRVFNVSGHIRFGEAGLAGVLVTNRTGGGVTTPAGEYTVTNVPEGENIFVPTLAGYRFEPTFFPTNVTGPITNIDFIATGNYCVTGAITANGAGLSGVSVLVTNQTLVRAGTTDSLGHYVVRDLPPGNYVARPLLARYTFVPEATNVVVTQAMTTVNFQGVPVVNISGRVTETNTGLAGIEVQTVGELRLATRTDSGGYYTLVNAAAGINTVFPTNSAFEFEPGERITNATSSTGGVDFTGTRIFSVSGLITITNTAGVGLSNVVVTIGNRTSITASNGTFRVSNLRAGTYEVMPALPGYAFTRTDATTNGVTVGPNLANVNFSANGILTLSGRVVDRSRGVSNVSILVSNQALGRTVTVRTDSLGVYSVTNLTPASYLVRPSLNRHAFLPASTNVTLDATQPVTTVNFRALPLINLGGRVTDGTNGLANVTVEAVGELLATNRTDLDGFYTLTNATAGTNTVFASHADFDFEPVQRMVDTLTNLSDLNFTGIYLYAVSGRITGSGVGVSNVLVTAGARTHRSDASGNYRVSRLGNGTYEVTPDSPGYTFMPSNFTVTVGPSTGGVDFAASGTLTISGRVLEGVTGLSNVVVTAATSTNVGSILTDASGSYGFSNLAPRTFLLSADPLGVGFSPPSVLVVLDGTNAFGIDFLANPTRLSLAWQTNGAAIAGLGLPLRDYLLQVATNLPSDGSTGVLSSAWLPLSLLSASTNGLFEFLDTETTNAPMKFYRSLRP